MTGPPRRVGWLPGGRVAGGYVPRGLVSGGYVPRGLVVRGVASCLPLRVGSMVGGGKLVPGGCLASDRATGLP